MTSFKKGYLSAESISSTEPGLLLSGVYDLAIFTSSWDKRCASVINESIRTKYSILLKFKNRDKEGLRDSHDVLLEGFVASCSDKFLIIEDDSTNFDHLLDEILKYICFVWAEIKRPLSILIDFSSCPRLYTLAVLGFCMKAGKSRSISFFYAEGNYITNNNNKHKFTRGNWKTLLVPFFEGINNIGQNKFFLVSVGFEGDKTLQIIGKEDPDRVSLLFPDPGTHSDYVARATRSNRSLIDKYCIPSDHIIRSHACDSVAAWEKLDKYSMANRNNDDVFYLTCGTKPHALALALNAICHHSPKLLYRAPENYEVMTIVPTGIFWKFTIQDHSALS